MQQQKKTSGDNAIAHTDDNNKLADEELGARARQVVAQKGGTATLPCKFSEPGAGIVSITTFSKIFDNIFYFYFI